VLEAFRPTVVGVGDVVAWAALAPLGEEADLACQLFGGCQLQEARAIRFVHTDDIVEVEEVLVGDGTGATLEGVAPPGAGGAGGVDLVVAFGALTRYVVAEESFG